MGSTTVSNNRLTSIILFHCTQLGTMMVHRPYIQLPSVKVVFIVLIAITCCEINERLWSTHAWSNKMIMSSSTTTKSKTPRILSVGLSAVDFVATVDHFPKPDEKMRSTSLIVEGGGNAANTACAIAQLLPRGSSTLLTAVGDDPNGNIIIDGLQNREVNVIAERYPGNSPFSYILCHNDENDKTNTRSCIHQPSSGDMSIDFAINNDEIYLQDFTTVHFDVRYPIAANALAKQCLKLNIPYSVDVERPRPGLEEILQDASIVICNSNYCQTVDLEKGIGGTIECLTRVMKQQAPKADIAIQTLGDQGSCLVFLNDEIKQHVLNENGNKDIVLFEESEKDGSPIVTLSSDGTIHCSTFRGCEVVDTTGAGDAFIGGFLSALWSYFAACDNDKISTLFSNVKVLGRALRIASRVAARKIEKPGARSGLPSIENDEILQREFEALLEKQAIVK